MQYIYLLIKTKSFFEIISGKIFFTQRRFDFVSAAENFIFSRHGYALPILHFNEIKLCIKSQRRRHQSVQFYQNNRVIDNYCTRYEYRFEQNSCFRSFFAGNLIIIFSVIFDSIELVDNFRFLYRLFASRMNLWLAGEMEALDPLPKFMIALTWMIIHQWGHSAL